MKIDLYRFFRTAKTLWTLEFHLSVRKYHNTNGNTKVLTLKLPAWWG